VFNPQRQTERFDKDLNYVDRWVPEHIELDYPAPMVDLASSRQAVAYVDTNLIYIKYRYLFRGFYESFITYRTR